MQRLRQKKVEGKEEETTTITNTEKKTKETTNSEKETRT